MDSLRRREEMPYSEAVEMSQESSSSSDADGLTDPKIAKLHAFEELLPSPAPAQVEEIEWAPSMEMFQPRASVSMSTGQVIYVQDLTLENLIEYARSTNRTIQEYYVQHVAILDDYDQARLTLRQLGTENSVGSTDLRKTYSCLEDILSTKFEYEIRMFDITMHRLELLTHVHKCTTARASLIVGTSYVVPGFLSVTVTRGCF